MNASLPPDRLEHPPRRGTGFEPEDEAYLVGPHEELLAVLRRDQPVSASGLRGPCLG